MTAPATGSVRPNLWTNQLTSYAFEVKTALGDKPMRYFFARRFDQEMATEALTMLFVIEPAVLFGTYVRIVERAGGVCEAHSYLPTMARPLRVAERLLFDCLPLTDVSYVDLMAWAPPGLRLVEDIAGTDGRGRLRTFRYAGSAGAPALLFCEKVDQELNVVTRRALYTDGRQVRRWEIAELGEPGQESLARRIRVMRPHTGHRTEFIRSGPAVHVPPEAFDLAPHLLRDRIADIVRTGVVQI